MLTDQYDCGDKDRRSYTDVKLESGWNLTKTYSEELWNQYSCLWVWARLKLLYASCLKWALQIPLKKQSFESNYKDLIDLISPFPHLASFSLSLNVPYSGLMSRVGYNAIFCDPLFLSHKNSLCSCPIKYNRSCHFEGELIHHSQQLQLTLRFSEKPMF